MTVRRVTTKSGKDGPDLNDVARDVLRAPMEERGITSPAGLALALNQPQRSMDRLLKPGGKFDLKRLSRLLPEVPMSPVEFFASHPDFKPQARALIRLERDSLYDRICDLLSGDERKALVDGVEELRDLGVYEVAVKTLQGIIDAGKLARQKAIRETRYSRPPEA